MSGGYQDQLTPTCQYVVFFRKLQTSASWEMMVLTPIVARDAQSITGRNLLHIKQEYCMDPWSMTVGAFMVKDVRKPIPDFEEWRVGFLRQLLSLRSDMDTCGEDNGEITSLTDSLCIS